jgi:tetratricopeptide (TPR) repeat protein
METRDLLLVTGFLRGGRMFPVAIPLPGLPAQRSLRRMLDTLAESERALAGMGVEGPATAAPALDLRERSALTAWSGDFLGWAVPIGEVPDPGVVLCLVYDGPAADAALPIDVFAQTLRRYALRDPAMRVKLDGHLHEAGTFVPSWLTPEVRRRRSNEAFARAVATAREQGFAAAAPLFDCVRGERYADAQIAVATHEMREIGDIEAALARLAEVLRVAPRNTAARMLRAEILSADAGRRVAAADDWLAVLREIARSSDADPSGGVGAAARAGLRELGRSFRSPKKLEAAGALVREDPERGFDALSRYVHTHPCAWDAQILLASLALGRQSFDLAIQLLSGARWIYPDRADPHFVYGQALAARGDHEAAVMALEHAARVAPGDAEIARWLAFARKSLPTAEPASVKVAHHVVRTLLLLVGFVRGGQVFPAVLTLHRVPGDVSLALVVQALAAQEQRRFGTPPAPASAPPSSGEPQGAEEGSRPDGEVDLRAVGERVVLLDRRGVHLSVEQLVGDVPDPGVLLALLYETVGRDAVGRVVHAPPPAECEKTIAAIAAVDTEISAKLTAHLESSDASLLSRLELQET